MLNLQHNVVSILYAIKGAIEVHEIKAAENAFKTQAEALEHMRAVLQRIYNQANRALAITKRISRVMKSQRKADEPIFDVSVKEAWGAMIEVLKRQYSFKKLEVLDYIPEEYPFIKCGRNDLLEILYTLSQNAIQAMNREGKLIIRANLQFTSDGSPLAVITLSDTGPGISEAILNRLFEPFFTTKPLEEGNGLGLCLVKSLVKKNGGCVSVSSFKGCGATFMLQFAVSHSIESRKGTVPNEGTG